MFWGHCKLGQVFLEKLLKIARERKVFPGAKPAESEISA